VPKPAAWPRLEEALDANPGEVDAAWERLAYRPPAYTNFSWHIQSTVRRVILLALLWREASAQTAAWCAVLDADKMTTGHDGNATGFNAETLKLIASLPSNPRWIALKNTR
jgi:hypothetical protein